MGKRYFAHDNDSRKDPRIWKMMRKFGAVGYAAYFCILEDLTPENDFQLEYDNDVFEMLNVQYMTDMDDFGAFVDFCISIGLFAVTDDGAMFYSPALKRRKEEQINKTREARIAAGRKSGEARRNKALQSKQEEANSSEFEQNQTNANKCEQNGTNPNKHEQETTKGTKIEIEIENIQQQENNTRACAREEGMSPSEVPFDRLDGVGIDYDWARVVDAYEGTFMKQIPMGKEGQVFSSFVDDLSADAVILAIDYVNSRQVDEPYPFLRKILNTWAEAGVHDVATAQAQLKAHEQGIAKGDRRAQRKKSADQEELVFHVENNVIYDQHGKWYARTNPKVAHMLQYLD